MSDRPLEHLVDELHRVAADAATVPDGELLARFVRQRDPAAFELIVWRHGAMVQAVCRHVLGRRPDVDDAFQATFLVLLRKARSIRRRDSLAGWLHGVAFRVAQRCRRSTLTRLRHEHNARRPEALPPANVEHSDLGPILHAEIERLPERLRRPLVLCHLEGRTNAEAAQVLNVPHGTVLSRLSRAREQLRRRLVRRGVALGTGATALAIADPVSAQLVESTVSVALNYSAGAAVAGPAVTLAQGVIHAMFVRKVNLLAAGLLAASIVAGIGLSLASQMVGASRADDTPGAEKPASIAAPQAEAPEKPGGDKPAKPGEAPAGATPLELMLPRKTLPKRHEDEENIIGIWQVVDVKYNGEQRDPEDMRLVIGPFGTMLIQNSVGLTKRGATREPIPMTYKLDPSAKPPLIELEAGQKKQLGIYKIEGVDDLMLCMNASSDKPPKAFESHKVIGYGLDQVLFRLVRTAGSVSTNWAEKMFVKGTSHNFGAVKRGDKAISYKFVFKNVFDRPIELTQLQPADYWRGQPSRRAGGFGGRPGDDFPETGYGSSGFFVRQPKHYTLRPGEEGEIETAAWAGEIHGDAKLIFGVSFRVKDLERRVRGADVEIVGPFRHPDPRGSVGSAKTDYVFSSVELTLTAKGEGGSGK